MKENTAEDCCGSEIVTKFVTFTNHLTAISKTQYILQNLINVGNNTLVVPKPSFVIGLIIVKLLIVSLRTKN